MQHFTKRTRGPLGDLGNQPQTQNPSGDECVFVEKAIKPEYLAEEATCLNAAKYYYSCQCGKFCDVSFSTGTPLEHDYSAEKVEPKYLKKEATCSQEGEYYKSCIKNIFRSDKQ